MAGPLAGLLLLSRPAVLREWLWLLGTSALAAAWLLAPGGLAGQFERSAAVMLTGAFLALTLWRPLPLFRRAVLAVLATLAGLVLWGGVYDVGWRDVRAAKVQEWWAGYRAWAAMQGRTPVEGLPADAGAPASVDEQMFAQTAAAIESAAPIYPALLVLGALLGLWVAWAWYHRIARRPLGLPAGRLADFRFSDQTLWLLVLALALLVTPASPRMAPVGVEALRDLGRNLLLVGAALYALRGLAVFWTAARLAPRAIVATLAVVALFLFPFAAGGLTLLGIADSWLDFRRRLASSTTGGYER